LIDQIFDKAVIKALVQDLMGLPIFGTSHSANDGISNSSSGMVLDAQGRESLFPGNDGESQFISSSEEKESSNSGPNHSNQLKIEILKVFRVLI
jgi:hypothetical protein